jgi:tryptophanyl-tRNA synthetase
VNTVYEECTTAKRGCVDCKRHLAANINKYLEPLRERRRELEKCPDYVKDVLKDGGNQARAIAQKTIEETYQKMGLAD